MAGDWIKMRVDLASDPSVADIGIALDIGEDLVVGKLHRFWAWVTTHFAEAKVKPDSEATRGWIDRYVGAPGFVNALLAVGWMTVDEGYLSITKYDRHMSEGAKSRALKNEQQRARRGSKSEAKLKPRNGVKHASREEKRREDRDTSKDVSPRAQKFVKPTVEEVANYCLERDNGIDAKKFVAYYESCGWMVGKNKRMTNWQGAVHTWEENSKTKQQKVADEKDKATYDPNARD